MRRKFTEKLLWQFTTLIALVILFASPLTTGLQLLGGKHGVAVPSVVEVVNADEIYPMFTCPCCDQPLNKEEPCCGAAVQMIDFIDQKVSAGAAKDDIVLSTVQEFGLERLTEDSSRAELKAKLLENAPEDAPRIYLSEVKRDLGNVSLAKGIATTDFVVKNEGKSDLVVDKLSSSCGCTSGSLISQGVEGPRFYMSGHGQAEPDPSWAGVIAPGQEALVRVYYDPTVHPELVGPVTRTVSLHTNDPVNFETKLTITLEQTK